jgi:Protein of unknown function (DUF4232)
MERFLMRFGPTVAGAGVVAVLALGCSGSSHRAAAPSTSVARPSGSTTVVTAAPSTGGPATSTTSVKPTSTTAAGAAGAGCTTAHLSLSVVDHGAAAGTAYRDLVFKNTSAQSCTLFGYPGVSFLDNHGVQIGAPAQRSGGGATTITLAAGATAVAQLAYHDVYVSTFPSCQPTTSSSMKVYPPNETAALVVPTSLMVCANPAATGTADISVVKSPSSISP